MRDSRTRDQCAQWDRRLFTRSAAGGERGPGSGGPAGGNDGESQRGQTHHEPEDDVGRVVHPRVHPRPRHRDGHERSERGDDPSGLAEAVAGQEQADSHPTDQRGRNVTRREAVGARQRADLVDRRTLAAHEMVDGQEGRDLRQHRHRQEDHRFPFPHHRENHRHGPDQRDDRQRVTGLGDESCQVGGVRVSTVGHVCTDRAVPVAYALECLRLGDQQTGPGERGDDHRQTDEEREHHTTRVRHRRERVIRSRVLVAVNFVRTTHRFDGGFDGQGVIAGCSGRHHATTHTPRHIG